MSALNDLLEAFYALKADIPLYDRKFQEKAKILEQKIQGLYRERKDEEEESLKRQVSQLKTEVANLRKEVKKHKEEAENHKNEVIALKVEMIELKVELTDLKEEASEWKKRARIADTINAGEAMKIVIHHLGKFIYPPTKKMGLMRLKEILSEIENDPELNKIWQELLRSCGMEEWTTRHKTVNKSFIIARDNEAHYRNFNFEALLAAMLEIKPNYENECKDIVQLFKKVNYLMKFGIIGEELVQTGAKIEKETKELLDRGKRWAKRDVEDLQYTKLIEAKEHVVQYFPDVSDSIWKRAISFILAENLPRFCKLVKNKVAEILDEVPQIFEQKRYFGTLLELIMFSRRGKWRKECVDDGLKWHETTKGIYWTESHDNALREMEGQLPDEKLKDISPLPLHVAKLHVADFVPNIELWKESWEIFEIFGWKRKKIDKMRTRAKSNQSSSTSRNLSC